MAGPVRPAGGLVDFAGFYAFMPGDNAATVGVIAGETLKVNYRGVGLL